MIKWLSLVIVLLAAPVRAERALTEAGAENRLIVAYKLPIPDEPNFAEGLRRAAIELQGLTIIDSIHDWGMYLVEAPKGKVQAAMESLRNLPGVEGVEPDIWTQWIEEVSFQGTPLPTMESFRQTLPKFAPTLQTPPNRFESEVQWGVKRVNAPAAWASNQGAGVKVAIVDTGIDPNHPELKDKIAGGFNAVDKKKTGDAPWADDHFHGTHVAGIVAAKLDGAGVVGVAPKATLYAVKVLTAKGSGSLFGIIAGMNWCATNKMDVANMSLGAPQGNFLFKRAVDNLAAAGVTVVAAAGNDGKAVNFPAAYETTIAVSALCPPGVTEAKLCTSTQEGIAKFSSRGPQVDFAAPGVKVPSSVPLAHDPSGVKAYSGTSMAAPHVAGLAALAVAKGAKGPDQVRAALKAAAQKLPGLSADEQGAGLVDAGLLAR